MIRTIAALSVALGLLGMACDDDGPVVGTPGPDATDTSPPAATSPSPDESPEARGPVRLDVEVVARDLDTVWSLAWDAQDRLWFTERPGRLTRLDGPTRTIDGVVENGEAGLMGLEFDDRGRIYLMYTAEGENRIVRLDDDGSQDVLVDGIPAASIHDGGRLRFGPDGSLYASTGDASQSDLADDDSSLAGKILRINVRSGNASIFSKGHRNAQGLCFAPGGRFLSTEHGPDFGDEINDLVEGQDYGWPETSGNGIYNYTPTIAPAGCAVYDGDLIPQWRGSMLFATLKDQSLRRLTFRPNGAVRNEQVLFQERFGRLRDVAVGPDGAIYLATSNHDGRGSPREGDDRVLRLTPRD
ncbi:MAG: PQQ-dependent sugar dehydrogenase [Actinomycetota bacterium]